MFKINNLLFDPSKALLVSLTLAACVACGGGGGNTSIVDDGNASFSNGQDSNGQESDTISVGDGNASNSQTGNKSTISNTGSMTVVITDGPAEDFDRIDITLVGIELLGEDNGPVTIFSGEEKFDLLGLRNFSEILAVENAVPVGTYSKIRLRVSKIELINLDDNGEVASLVEADLPANGKIDLNPRGEFDIVGDTNTVVTLDIDANKSIKVHRAGKKDKYKFRPVVFVNIESQEIEAQRLIQFEGTVFEVDTAGATFLLCGDMGETEVCYDIVVDSATSLYNSVPELITIEDIELNSHAKVAGWLQAREETAATDVDDSEAETSEEGTIESELVFKAAVAEIGEASLFSVTAGTVATVVNVSSSTLILTVGDTQVSVQLNEGTQIFNQSGVMLAASDLVEGDALEVSGVYQVVEDDNDIIGATIIFVYEDGGEELIIGEVAELNSTKFEVVAETGNRCVVISPETEILVLMASEFSMGELSGVVNGTNVEVYGVANAESCIAATKIIINDESVASAEPPVAETE